MKHWQAVVFDMDDTLYPERDYVLSGFRAVAEWSEQAFGINANDGYAHFHTLFTTGVRGDTFNRWLHHFQIIQPDSPREVIQQTVTPLIDVYRNHMPQIQPFPEAAALLPALSKIYQLGVVSDGYEMVQQRKWAALNIASYFTAVVFSDHWGREAWKPSTKPFHEVLRGFAVAPEQAVYIGDNPRKDFLGAREVGMATIWLRRADGEYTAHEPPTAAHQPDEIIASWAALQSELLPEKVYHT
ncbi:MAG: HAD family hydrolase [Caldilineaceae bacterium]|nr:HAD family hydrolase [Caldilineaceae bacterium]MCB0127919.1 HAD family hydrolase [Caldilineaceae bacterium]